MTRHLGMKCSSCGHWNRVSVNKIFVKPDSPEPKVEVMIPMYQPLEVTRCEKCGKIIAEPKELVRIELDGKTYIAKRAQSDYVFIEYKKG